MWIDTRKEMPTADGEYVVQTVYGSTKTMMYTQKGGWNTYYDRFGELHGSGDTYKLYVVRWYDVPTPQSVPATWFDEFWRKESENERNTETVETV